MFKTNVVDLVEIKNFVSLHVSRISYILAENLNFSIFIKSFLINKWKHITLMKK